MKPTEILKHEHQVIQLVIGAMEEEAAEIGKGGVLSGERIRKLLDFVKNFADRCHHVKEERVLFAKLKEKGMPTDQGPIFVMRKEHEKGRRTIAAISEALPRAEGGERTDIETIRDNLLQYAELLKGHIKKEDDVLYPMAEKMLSQAEQREIAEAFEQIEVEKMGQGAHEHYHELAHELTKEHSSR